MPAEGVRAVDTRQDRIQGSTEGTVMAGTDPRVALLYGEVKTCFMINFQTG